MRGDAGVGRGQMGSFFLALALLLALVVSTPLPAPQRGSAWRACSERVVGWLARVRGGSQTWTVADRLHTGRRVRGRDLPSAADNLGWVTQAGLLTADGTALRSRYLGAGYAWDPGYLWYLVNRYPRFFARYGFSATMPQLTVTFWDAAGLNAHLDRLGPDSGFSLPFRFSSARTGTVEDYAFVTDVRLQRGLQEGMVVLGAQGDPFVVDHHFLLPGVYLLTPRVFEAFRARVSQLRAMEATVNRVAMAYGYFIALQNQVLGPLRRNLMNAFRETCQEIAQAVLFEDWERVETLYGTLIGDEEAGLREFIELMDRLRGRSADWRDTYRGPLVRDLVARVPRLPSRLDLAEEVRTLRERLGAPREVQEPDWTRRNRSPRYDPPVPR